MTESKCFRVVNFVLLAAACLHVFSGNGIAKKPKVKNAIETFERGIPAYWIPSRRGSLELSTSHSKHGKHCLKWNWRRADSIRIQHGIGNIRRTGGYGGGRAKANFGLWYYVEKPITDKAVVQFRTGSKITGWFDLPLNFKGWRRAHLRYTWRPQFKGKVSPKTDNIKIIAPMSTRSGAIFFDLVVYNGVMHWQTSHVPSGKNWTPVKPDETRFPLPKKVTQEEIASIRKISNRLNSHIVETEKSSGNGEARASASQIKIDRIFGTYVTEPVTDEAMKDVQKEFAELKIVRKAGWIRGKPFVFRPAFYKEFIPEGIGYPRDITNLMKKIGQFYHRTDNPEYRTRLAKWYVDISDHIYDQGMANGVGFNWGWYPGRALSDATFLMREALKRHGVLRRESDYLGQNSGFFSRVFAKTTINPNMDHFYMNTPNQLKCSLLQATPREQVRCLRAFSSRLSKEIMHIGGNGFKPDGSAYHHGMHYFAYADYCVNNLVSIVHVLRGTEYQVTPEALARLKKVVLAMRFYCNWRDLPLPLSGRHPFALDQRVNHETLLTLAMTGSADGKHDIDADLAAAFLRFCPEKQNNPIFRKYNITPEKTPRGNMTMNYACLTAHRRDNWLALVKGYGLYKGYGEIYAKHNRYGRYISNGYLDILAGGDPVTQKASGCAGDGWDWNRLDGTTVIYLPRELLVARSKGTEWMGSSEAFVGGLSHRKRNGAFVMQIQGHRRHDPTFKAKKTYFFFDNRIICLGSNIVNNNAKHETHTNLFQKHLPKTTVPIHVNGHDVQAFPADKILSPKQANCLIDTQGTGYYLPAGQKIHFARKRQKNRNPHDTKYVEGNFASAWINHGKTPKNAQYEYAVLIRTQPEKMRALSAAMANPKTAPYTVLQKDRLAHVVFDRKTVTYGCVFFEAQDVKLSIPVKKVDHSCLVMVEKTPNGLYLSLADPDLNLVKFISQPRQIRVTLEGQWKITNPSKNFRITTTSVSKTVIEFTCRHGNSLDVELTKAGQ